MGSCSSQDRTKHQKKSNTAWNDSNESDGINPKRVFPLKMFELSNIFPFFFIEIQVFFSFFIEG